MANKIMLNFSQDDRRYLHNAGPRYRWLDVGQCDKIDKLNRRVLLPRKIRKQMFILKYSIRFVQYGLA